MAACRRRKGGYRKLRRNSGKPVESAYRRAGASEREWYRVTQLVVSGTVFILLVAVKLLFPKQMDLVSEPLGQILDNNMDVAEVFSVVGSVFSDREWKDETVYQAVFGPQSSDDAENQENISFESDRDTPDILYTEANLPDDVELQQTVLGFDYCAPVNGTISSYFGYRKNPTGENDRFHYGLDMTAEKGTEIVSFADGVVTVTAESSSYGKYLIIVHDNGCTTLYAHCERILASSGQSVKKGEIVAAVGDSGQTTGAHLHFELQKDGIYLNPIYYVA